MEYQSLYRRYRPQKFAEVKGQHHVIRALQNAVRDNRVGHAYLLSGARGTGKTTLARILAKVLNCEQPSDGEPCGLCPSCKSIEAGTSFDLHELDAASNNKVDDMRDLLSKVRLGTPGRTKVYLLDEVHMALVRSRERVVKTLEEPRITSVSCSPPTETAQGRLDHSQPHPASRAHAAFRRRDVRACALDFG
jgi:DNA polymerase-3 subunit gamma/tau